MIFQDRIRTPEKKQDTDPDKNTGSGCETLYVGYPVSFYGFISFMVIDLQSWETEVTDGSEGRGRL